MSGIPLNRPSMDPAFAKALPFVDLKQWTMRHSYTYAFVGSNNGSASAGMYVNSLSYQWTSSLRMQVDLGMANVFHNSLQVESDGRGLDVSKPMFTIPYAALEYKPSDNMTIGLHYMHTECANGMCIGPGFGYPWGRSHW